MKQTTKVTMGGELDALDEQEALLREAEARKKVADMRREAHDKFKALMKERRKDKILDKSSVGKDITKKDACVMMFEDGAKLTRLKTQLRDQQNKREYLKDHLMKARCEMKDAKRKWVQAVRLLDELTGEDMGIEVTDDEDDIVMDQKAKVLGSCFDEGQVHDYWRMLGFDNAQI